MIECCTDLSVWSAWSDKQIIALSTVMYPALDPRNRETALNAIEAFNQQLRLTDLNH